MSSLYSSYKERVNSWLKVINKWLKAVICPQIMVAIRWRQLDYLERRPKKERRANNIADFPHIVQANRQFSQMNEKEVGKQCRAVTPTDERGCSHMQTGVTSVFDE